MRGMFIGTVLWCAVFVAACGGDDQPAAAEKAAPAPETAKPAAAPDIAPAAPANALSVGMKVVMSAGGKIYDLEIMALYGKLALVKFRRDQAVKGSSLENWVDAGALEPKGTPQQLPAGEVCRVSAGQQVSCPFLTDRRRYPGRVTEVHGKMAQVRYDSDGALIWNFCTECKTR